MRSHGWIASPDDEVFVLNATAPHADHGQGPARQGLLLVISGPSGVGKTTITREVERQLGGVFSVSLTSRAPAPTDRQGVDYHFVSSEAFERQRDNHELLEWAQVFGNYYGTPRKPVEQALAAGRLMILEIDVQGAIQIKKNMPQAFAIFILPPSESVLLQRLRNRQREDESVIQKRFAKATAEIDQARQSGIYDRFIVNDDLQKTIRETVKLVEERCARQAACE